MIMYINTKNNNKDLASSSRPNPPPSRRPSRGLLDVTNVNINNSEIDKVTINIQRKVKVKIFQDSALFILSAARQALDATGDTAAPGAHGKVGSGEQKYKNTNTKTNRIQTQTLSDPLQCGWDAVNSSVRIGV